MRPRLFQERERSIFADMRFLRIASTAAVRTHRQNKRFGSYALTLIFSCWEYPNPYLRDLKILFELFGKPLDFIR